MDRTVYPSTRSGSVSWNIADHDPVSGAFCSNEIFSRYLAGINRTFPAVLEDEIPSFLEDVAYVNASTGTNTFYADRESNNTVYALWIGTNDLGLDAFLTDSQHAGLTITDFIGCVWQVFDAIYGAGGRHFVLLNEAPLEHTPLYAAPQNGGLGDNHYWTNKTAYNMTEYEQKMKEYTTNVNTMFDYGVPVEARIKARWPDASFAVFDVHQLILDIRASPENYLDAPANVTGYYYHCAVDGSNCTQSEDPLSSFLWYDELHPSERTGKSAAACFRDESILTPSFSFRRDHCGRVCETCVGKLIICDVLVICGEIAITWERRSLLYLLTKRARPGKHFGNLYTWIYEQDIRPY